MVTLKTIADCAGVSINTVSRALNGKTQASWPTIAARTERIREISRELGYRPNSAARAMRTRSTRYLGVLMAGGYRAPYEFPVISSINCRLHEEGYAVSVIDADSVDMESPEQTLAFKEDFLEGIFIMQVPVPLRDYAASVIRNYVHVDSDVREPTNCVYRDERSAGKLATRQASERGYKGLVFATGDVTSAHDVHPIERRRAVEKEAAKLGLPLQIFEAPYSTSDRLNKAPELASMLRPELAVVTDSESMAEYCAHATARANLIPGRDYGLVSCADAASTFLTWPWLSRVTFNRDDSGARAAEIMLSLLKNKGEPVPSEVFRNEWIEGDTLRVIAVDHGTGAVLSMR